MREKLLKILDELSSSKVAISIAHGSFALLVIISVIIAMGREDGINNDDIDIYPIGLTGEYSVDDGQSFAHFESYSDMDTRYAQSAVIRGHVDRDILDSESIYIFINDIDVEVFCNDKKLNVETGGIPYYWTKIEHSGISSKDDIEIRLKTRSRLIYNRVFRKTLERIYVASHGALLINMIRKNALNIAACVLLFLIGLCMIMYMLELSRYNFKNGKGILAGGLALIIGSLAFLINPDYSTLLFDNVSGLGYIDPLAQNLIILSVIAYLQRFISDDIHKLHGKLTVLAAGLIIMVFMVTSIFSGVNTTYIVVLLVSDALLIILNIFFLSDQLSRNDDKVFRWVVNAALILLLCMVLEIVFYVLTGTYLIKIIEIGLIQFGVTQYWAFSVESVTQRRVASRATALEQELVQSQINIMMSQIQPHFLFNALGTIRALCTKKPEEARQALDFFAKYLRANMESLEQKECIPFSKELEHVKSYLYIEKLRFGELLNIEYDIQATDFKIPCMTVQTLCENAVKHGLLGKEDGGTLTIRSKENPSCYEIQIIDDGVGFDATKKFDDSRTHVGIENSRKRLAGMCGGSLAIGSVVGRGTTITITIPRERDVVTNYMGDA